MPEQLDLMRLQPSRSQGQSGDLVGIVEVDVSHQTQLPT